VGGLLSVQKRTEADVESSEKSSLYVLLVR